MRATNDECAFAAGRRVDERRCSGIATRDLLERRRQQLAGAAGETRAVGAECPQRRP